MLSSDRICPYPVHNVCVWERKGILSWPKYGKNFSKKLIIGTKKLILQTLSVPKIIHKKNTQISTIITIPKMNTLSSGWKTIKRYVQNFDASVITECNRQGGFGLNQSRSVVSLLKKTTLSVFIENAIWSPDSTFTSGGSLAIIFVS